MNNWKDFATNMYENQDNKSIKEIKAKILEVFGTDVNYNYIKSAIYKKLAKAKKLDKEISKPKGKQKIEYPDIYNNKFKLDLEGSQYEQIGIVSDTHMGSKHQQITYLNEVYDIFKARGIKHVFHSGDITEGSGMRKGHEHEIFLHGADEQTEYIIDNYPKRDGITTYFILGNHDMSHMKNGGTNIGKRIDEKRDDMVYLGVYNAKINLGDNCIMELNHPLDGASYAISYAIQKMADSYSGNAKPNILINGHHHKMAYLFYRNIHCIEAGTFEAQTPFMRGKRISAHVGGIILHINLDDTGTIKSFAPEFITYYDEIENDY
jgi:predicted phosphodiesterase